MKCSIVGILLLALAAVAVHGMPADMQQISKVCLAEAHVTENEIKDFFRNGMKAADAKDNIKCHMKCVMEKQGHLKNGVFDEAATLKTLKEMPELKDHQAEIERAVSDCKNERGTNDCDTAFKITTCIKENKSNLTP